MIDTLVYEKRRNERVALSIQVEVSYTDIHQQPQLERTHTLSVDEHGARIATASFHPVGQMIHLSIPHLGRSAHCFVRWCSAPANGAYEIGVEMEDQSNVWGVQERHMRCA